MGICASGNLAPASIPREFVGRWVQDEASLVYNLQESYNEEAIQDLLQKRTDAGVGNPDTASGSFAWLVANMTDATVEFGKATQRKVERDSGFNMDTYTKVGYSGRIREFGEEKWAALDGLMPYNFKIAEKEYTDLKGMRLLTAFVVNGVRLERAISFEEGDGKPPLWLLLSEMAEETLQVALRAMKDLQEETDTVQEESETSDEN